MVLNSKHLGIVSSLLAAILTAIFGVFVVFDEKMIYFTSVLLLSIFVVIMIISLKPFIESGKTVFVDCAVSFGVIYALLVDLVYYTQISVVLKSTLNSELLMIVSDSPGTVFFYIDMLGYCFLCLATLFIALSLNRSEKLLRLSSLTHGALIIPTFLLPFLPITFSTSNSSGTASGPIVLIAWCIIFIPVCLLLTRFYLKQDYHT